MPRPMGPNRGVPEKSKDFVAAINLSIFSFVFITFWV